MTKIAIILGSTRPNRVGAQVAAWVLEQATARTDAKFELVDLRDHALPHLDEPIPALLGRYQNEHTKRWAATVDAYDAFVFVTAEYNGHLPGALKDAIDYVYAEWRGKAAGIVSYGVLGGAGAAGQLRQMCGGLGLADVPKQVVLTLESDFVDYSVFKPQPKASAMLSGLLDDLIAWSGALRPLRTVSSTASAAG